MEIDNKKLERSTQWIHYTISAILCLFLILLSNKIISDLDQTVAQPQLFNFEKNTKINDLESKMNALFADIQLLQTKKNALLKSMTSAKENYENEKKSFDNWIETRRTVGASDKDAAVITRAKKLDEFYAVEKQWRQKVDFYENEISLRQKQQSILQKHIDTERGKALAAYQLAYQQYELKVFIIRLLFIAPILALGIFFFIKLRKHPYWPLFFGFSLFSAYAFLFGLVPYLPSYGGYVHYTLGILLSISLGFYAIKYVRLYQKKKLAELSISTQERAKSISISLGEKSFEKHICPSCGKDFLFRKWELPTPNTGLKLNTEFCRHCGLGLYAPCKQCQKSVFMYLPFCSNCGAENGY